MVPAHYTSSVGKGWPLRQQTIDFEEHPNAALELTLLDPGGVRGYSDGASSLMSAGSTLRDCPQESLGFCRPSTY